MTNEKNIIKRILCQNRITLLLLFALLCGWVVVTRPSIHGNDGVQNYVWLRSLMFDGNLDFTNEYAHYLSQQAHWFDHKDIPKDPVTGLPVNLYGVGNSILWAPWVILAHGIGLITNLLLGPVFDLDGYGFLARAGVSFGSTFYASVGLFLLYMHLRKRSNDAIAFWAVILFWFATPLFFYMYLHPSMSHANSFFLSACIVCLYFAGKTRRRWFLLGLSCGMLCVTRLQDGILLIPIAACEIINWVKNEDNRSIKQRVLDYFAATIGVLIPIIPQLIGWKILQGGYFTGPRGYLSQGSINLLQPHHITDVLFSAKHGLIYCHPILLLPIIGLFFKPQLARTEKLVGMAAFACVLWVVGSWSIWWAGASFGQRMFISLYPFIIIGLAGYDIFATVRRRNFFIVLTLVAIVWNFLYIVRYASGSIDRQDKISYRQILFAD